MIGDRVICLRIFGGLLLNARSEKCSQMLSPKYFPHSFFPRKHLLSDPLAAADNLFHFHSVAYQQTCANLLPEGRWNRLRKHNKHCVVKKFVPFSENTFWCPQGVVFLRWSLFYHSKALFFSVKTIFSATKSDSTAPKNFFLPLFQWRQLLKTILLSVIIFVFASILLLQSRLFAASKQLGQSHHCCLL